jgi:DNA-binding NarL/FixJ family response regulator
MRVVLADDEALLREGLVRLLAEAGFEVVGSAKDAAGLMHLVETRDPDVAITDIKMPPTHTDEGLVAAHEIRRRFPAVGVLVLSHYLESRYAMTLVEELPEALRLPAQGPRVRARLADRRAQPDRRGRDGDRPDDRRRLPPPRGRGAHIPPGRVVAFMA